MSEKKDQFYFYYLIEHEIQLSPLISFSFSLLSSPLFLFFQTKYTTAISA